MDILPDAQTMLEYGTDLLSTGNKFLLYGDLGTGKTTLAKGIAKGLGIDPDEVQSPTYTYIHIYAEKLLHIDMRRIETKQQLVDLGIYDLIDQYESIIIEWPKREKSYIDASWQALYLKHADQGRVVTCGNKTSNSKLFI